MSNLTIAQHSLRYFSYSQALVATIMILGALWLRLTTGWYAASFLFFVFGLVCVYMSITCMIAWKKWFLEGGSDAVLEKKRPKTIMVFIVFGGVGWVFFGLIVINSGLKSVYVNEFEINRTPQFERELQRFIKAAKAEGENPVIKYTDSKLILRGWGAGASRTMKMHKLYHKIQTANSHTHLVNIGGEKYQLTFLSHESHYGWSDYEAGGWSNKYTSDFCQFFVPFVAKTLDGKSVPHGKIEGEVPIFIEHKNINNLDIKLTKGELVVSHFLTPDQTSAEICKRGAIEYATTEKRTPLGTISLSNAPMYMVRYLAFPGFNDGVLGVDMYEISEFKDEFSVYIRSVEEVSRKIFD